MEALKPYLDLSKIKSFFYVPENNSEQVYQRYFLLALTAILLIGLMMVYSASYIYAKEQFGTSVYFALKQFIFMIIGITGAVILSKTKFNFWFRYSFYVHGVLGLLIFLTLIPGAAVVIKGSARWLNLGGFLFQPGEMLKYSSLLASVFYFQHFTLWQSKQRLIYSAILLAPILALVFQPDFGMFLLCLINVFFICYLSPFPRKIFYGLLGVSALSCSLILVSAPYRVQRLMSYLDPWNDPRGAGFQIVQSFLAFAKGSVFGAGIGNSNEKLFYLPEAHNDFILSVIGEELGLFGVTIMIILFFVLVYLGLKLAMQIKDYARSMFATGAIFAIGIQMFFNAAVVMGLLPTKGLTLPFVSYGGSALVSNLLLIGMFFSCLKYENRNPGTN
jgi:cell division protein FtsW